MRWYEDECCADSVTTLSRIPVAVVSPVTTPPDNGLSAWLCAACHHHWPIRHRSWPSRLRRKAHNRLLRLFNKSYGVRTVCQIIEQCDSILRICLCSADLLRAHYVTIQRKLCDLQDVLMFIIIDLIYFWYRSGSCCLSSWSSVRLLR